MVRARRANRRAGRPPYPSFGLRHFPPMRVIAGSAGGIPLHTPRTDLRPTMDRVKAAIFSSLGEKIIGARVLDLFAGSGALGIEALSRGAASATFVESDLRATETIRRNLEKTRLANAANTS